MEETKTQIQVIATEVHNLQMRRGWFNIQKGYKQEQEEVERLENDHKNKRLAAADKLYQHYCVNPPGNSDVTDEQVQVVHDWLDTHASRCFAVCERGAAAGKLHVQAVATIFTSGSLPVAKSLKEALGWIPHVPPGSKVMVSELAEKDMHTYLGMLGYCNKDAHKPGADFRVIIDVGNTPAMMEDGRIIFMKYHATSKGKVALSPSNILQKMVAYMNANRISSLPPGFLLTVYVWTTLTYRHAGVIMG
eukprot:jgi/Mesvir1/4654/Mv03469-RA.1